MRTEDAVEVFKTKEALAKAIGISPSAVYQWGDIVPKSRCESIRLAMRAKAEDMEREAKQLRQQARED